MKLIMKSPTSNIAQVAPRAGSRLLRVGSTAAASILLGGCILLSNSGVEEQCVTSADCSERASDDSSFQGTACVNSVCVSSLPPTTATSTSTGAGGTGGGSSTGCVGNQQCVDDNGGLPYMCINPGAACVSLISEDCQIVEGDFADENAIVFGHMMSLTGGFKFTAPHHQAASNLAMKEIDKVLAGLPGGPGGARRPLVMVSCDEDRDPEEAARFLVEDLGAKAIIGIINAENISKVANNVTVAADVLVMGAGASPFIVNLDDQGLVFSVVSDLTESVNAYPSVIREVEARIREERGLAEDEPIKVALLVSDRLDEKAKESTLLESEDFTFNGGLTWSENADLGNFQVFGYPDEAVDPDVDYSIPVAAMLEMEPDVIIAISGPELDQSIATPVEENWSAVKPGPYWLLPYKSPALLNIFAAPEERRLRARGVNYTQHDKSRYDQWVIRFKGELQNTSPGPWVEARYDAVFALAYAYMATSGIARPTGSDLAEGLLAIGNAPGIDIVVGSEDLQDAQNVLVAKGDVDVDGVYSNLNFNPATGWVSTDAAVFCISSEGEWADTGQIWRTGEAVMEGEYVCP